eukprot:TRINITY_DN1493_c0_g2_i1.p1 TRINITY_DN1493_c0_g2~~TRINITY_DN1493_c0_g2_i1.p1  ORF type:complete len:175 (-),score=14.23 TRINITY_DN1493_c0_g2_i1:99-623(-)
MYHEAGPNQERVYLHKRWDSDCSQTSRSSSLSSASSVDHVIRVHDGTGVPVRFTTAGALELARAASASGFTTSKDDDAAPISSASQLSKKFNEARMNKTQGGSLKNLPSMEAAIKQGVEGRGHQRYSGNDFDRDGRRLSRSRSRPPVSRAPSANWLGPEKQRPPAWKKLLCMAT